MSQRAAHGFGVRVSNQVIAADDLDRRVGAALSQVLRASMSFEEPVVGTAHSLSSIESISARAEHLHHLWATVTMPPFDRASGLRGRASRVVKRTMYRVAAWYIEPRWAAQREIDAELARFASDSAHAIDELRNEVAQLQSAVESAHRRLRDRERPNGAATITNDNSST